MLVCQAALKLLTNLRPVLMLPKRKAKGWSFFVSLIEVKKASILIPYFYNPCRKEILREAQGLVGRLEKIEERKTGEVYVKMMQRLLEKGSVFVDDEMKRLNKLMGGKLSQEKKTDMGYRINILRAFRDEL